MVFRRIIGFDAPEFYTSQHAARRQLSSLRHQGQSRRPRGGNTSVSKLARQRRSGSKALCILFQTLSFRQPLSSSHSPSSASPSAPSPTFAAAAGPPSKPSATSPPAPSSLLAPAPPPTPTPAHLVKSAAAEAGLALAFHLIGHKTFALRSLDAALNPPASKSLLDAERAELQIEINRRRRIDAAVSDLVEALRLCASKNSKACCLLGSRYEPTRRRERRRRRGRHTVRINATSSETRDGLKWLASD